jgi:hypothetical protein
MREKIQGKNEEKFVSNHSDLINIISLIDIHIHKCFCDTG